MTFNLAATNAQQFATASYNGSADPDYAALLQSIYGGQQPWNVDFSHLSAYAVSGEVLQYLLPLRYFQSPSVNSIEPYGSRSMIDLHSMALLVILRWASENNITAWRPIATPLLDALYSDKLGDALRLSAATGAAGLADQMMRMIAYSAIDEGVRPFGDKGIQALFDDAGELGRLVLRQDLAEYLGYSKVQTALAEIAVEYAGLLARNADTDQAEPGLNTGHEKGAIYLDDARSLLIGDFSRNLWKTSGTSESIDIVGKKSLTDAVSTFGSWNSSSSVQQAIDTMWAGKTTHVVKLIAKTTDVDGDLKAREDGQVGQGADAQPDDGAMLVGAGKKDVLYGYNGKDLLVGGLDNDTLIGGAGDDLMFGGSGDDTFQGYDDQHSAPDGSQDQTGYAGNDWIDGGTGNDTVDYSKRGVDHQITLAEGPQLSDAASSIKLTDPTGGNDILVSIERIRLSAEKDTLVLKEFYQQGSQKTLIDMGGEPDGAKQDPSQGDTLDFSQYGHGIYMKPGSTPLGDGYELFTDLENRGQTTFLVERLLLPRPPWPPAYNAAPEHARDLFLETRAAENKPAVCRGPDLIDRRRVDHKTSIRIPSCLVTPPQREILRMQHQPVAALAFRIAPITRPTVLARMADHSGAHRVELDIAMTREHVALGLRQA